MPSWRAKRRRRARRRRRRRRRARRRQRGARKIQAAARARQARLLEAFVESQPFTQEDFLAACQDALDAGAGGGDSYAHDAAGFSASIVNMVLMTSTYDFFVRVMIAAAAQEKLRRNLASMCASQPARSRPSDPLGCADPVACRKEREESTAGAE